MSTKEIIDFSDWVSPTQAAELVQYSMRQSFQYDWFNGQTRFLAVVLTNPLPLEQQDLSLFTGTPQTNFADSVKSALGLKANPRRISKFNFHARILGEKTPHSFYADPCDPNSPYAADSPQRNKLISMHTRFTSTEEYQLQSGQLPPCKGDLVLVDLAWGDDGYNLQDGTFVGVSTPEDVEHNIAAYAGDQACNLPLASVFAAAGGGGGGGGGLRAAYTGGTQNLAVINGGLNSAGLIQPSSVGYLKGHPRLLKDVAGDWDAMATAFNTHFAAKGWKLGGDGDRSHASQVKLKAEKPTLSAPPGTSNHGWGVAVDMHYYDKNGKKKSLSWSGPAYEWLFKNSPTHGWEHPYWAQDPAVSLRLGKACVPPPGKRCGSKKEVWHFESLKRDQLFTPGSAAFAAAQPAQPAAAPPRSEIKT